MIQVKDHSSTQVFYKYDLKFGQIVCLFYKLLVLSKTSNQSVDLNKTVCLLSTSYYVHVSLKQMYNSDFILFHPASKSIVFLCLI